MMQTNYDPYPPPEPPRPKKGKKPDPPAPNGERAKASTFFTKTLTAAVQTKLLPTAVYLRTGVAFGSGVILGVDQHKAYVLTAKHNLWALAGLTAQPADKSPGDYKASSYAGGIKIGYGPEELLGLPLKPVSPRTALVSGINYAEIEGSDASWTYDAILLESEDTDFIAHVKAKRFIGPSNCEQHHTLLRPERGKYPLFSRRNYKHVQLGYGKGRDDSVTIVRENYTSYEGKLQCKPSPPKADTTFPGALYEPQKRVDRSEWRSMSEGIEVSGSKTNSTAPGDSGGPLFAVSDTDIFLIGVTTGANWYGDEASLAEPPAESDIHNNVVTYWAEMYGYCEKTFLKTP